jgi:ubiquinone/menaquinone biosynthesis C-methylase UbiE
MTRRQLLSLTAAAPLAAQAPHHGKGHADPHHRRTAEEWVKILERPDRDAWQKPAEVVAALNLQPGQRAADIGAGSGYFSVRLAQAVGSSGKVYAVDIQQDLIDHLNERAAEADLTQMTGVLGEPADPKLPPASVDLIFICDVVHHIEDRQPYYAKLAAALRPGGRLAIVDFYKKELPVGPAPAMKIARKAMIGELAEAGFEVAASFDFLPYQYFLMFRRR